MPAGILGLVLLFFLSSSVAMGEMRWWHEKDGKEYQGEFQKELFGKVFLRGVDKGVFSVAATNLIDADMKYVYSKVPPKISVRFSKNIKKRDPGPFGRSGESIAVVKSSVKVQKVSPFPFYGVLNGELYIIAKEVATDDYRLADKKKFTVSFPDPKNDLYEFQDSVEIDMYDEYDGRRRGATYKGYVVAIYGLDGALMSLTTDLSWVKEEQLNLLRAMYVPTFFYEDCKKRSVPRPDAAGREYSDF